MTFILLYIKLDYSMMNFFSKEKPTIKQDSSGFLGVEEFFDRKGFDFKTEEVWKMNANQMEQYINQ